MKDGTWTGPYRPAAASPNKTVVGIFPCLCYICISVVTSVMDNLAPIPGPQLASDHFLPSVLQTQVLKDPTDFTLVTWACAAAYYCVSKQFGAEFP